MKKIIVNIKNIDEIKLYQDNNISNFLIPLKDFCVGYEEIDQKDILKINQEYYLLINRLLTKEDILVLKEELIKLNNNYLKGIFFEDLALLEIVKELKLNIELIYFPNHFATNYASINAFLKRNIDSVVVSNEITYEEIEEIIKQSNSPLVLQLFGYNQIMYSRRNLISNFNNEYHLNLNLDNKIKELNSQKELHIKENKYGTVIYDENIYNNLKLLNFKNNIKLFYINTMYLEIDEIFNILNNKNTLDNKGFLTKKTIYKIGDINE